tara:strand:+ start:744 stop:1085 length:342 start_codon:yes stop_codon:yes gene_type:complete
MNQMDKQMLKDTKNKKRVAKWEAVESEGRWRVREIEEDGNPITVVREVRNGVTARHIAAAPDLLAALEDVVKSAQAMMHPVAWMGESLANAITAGEEAIAKANKPPEMNGWSR